MNALVLLFLVTLNSGNSCVIYDYQDFNKDSRNNEINTKLGLYSSLIEHVYVFDADQIQDEFIQAVFPVQYDLDSFIAYCNE